MCEACGMANERRSWNQCVCEECDVRTFSRYMSYTCSRFGQQPLCFERRVYSHEQIRLLCGPVRTGPRQDEGLADWPFAVTRSWTLFADDIKVVKHGLEAAFGIGAEVLHALDTQGKDAHLAARSIFIDLQKQGPGEVPFMRLAIPVGNSRGAYIQGGTFQI